MTLEAFTNFLAGIDLKHYREKYQPIKLVEMDLPKPIQALDAMYTVYWNEKKLLDYENFYALYSTNLRSEIEQFRQKIDMCETCFYKGLPARIYRTWASIITQIHAGYVAESVFGPDTVTMSAELDHKGADFQVHYKDTVLNYQVKKTTHSREVRKEKKSKKPILGKFIDITYVVPNSTYFANPRKKDGTLRLPYKRFIEDTRLARLDNGFVIFTTAAFEPEKRTIDQV